MPQLFIPIRLHAQENHSYRPADILVFSTVYEGTYPKILALQPNRREQRRLAGRSNYMKTIGQVDYRVWDVVVNRVYGRQSYPRIGHSIFRRVQITVAPAGVNISPAIQQVLPPQQRNIVNTARMVRGPPWASGYDDMLIARVAW